MSSYNTLSFAADPESAKASFTNNYDLDNPLQALNSYSRLLHAHTKTQLESSVRRTASDSPPSSGRSSPKPQSLHSGNNNPRRTAANVSKPVSSLAALDNERSSGGSQDSRI